MERWRRRVGLETVSLFSRLANRAMSQAETRNLQIEQLAADVIQMYSYLSALSGNEALEQEVTESVGVATDFLLSALPVEDIETKLTSDNLRRLTGFMFDGVLNQAFGKPMSFPAGDIAEVSIQVGLLVDQLQINYQRHTDLVTYEILSHYYMDDQTIAGVSRRFSVASTTVDAELMESVAQALNIGRWPGFSRYRVRNSVNRTIAYVNHQAGLRARAAQLASAPADSSTTDTTASGAGETYLESLAAADERNRHRVICDMARELAATVPADTATEILGELSGGARRYALTCLARRLPRVLTGEQIGELAGQGESERSRMLCLLARRAQSSLPALDVVELLSDSTDSARRYRYGCFAAKIDPELSGAELYLLVGTHGVTNVTAETNRLFCAVMRSARDNMTVTEATRLLGPTDGSARRYRLNCMADKLAGRLSAEDLAELVGTGVRDRHLMLCKLAGKVRSGLTDDEIAIALGDLANGARARAERCITSNTVFE